MNPKYAAMIHVEWQKLSGIVNVLLNATIFLPTSTKNLWHTTAVHSFSHPREDIEDTWSGAPDHKPVEVDSQFEIHQSNLVFNRCRQS